MEGLPISMVIYQVFGDGVFFISWHDNQRLLFHFLDRFFLYPFHLVVHIFILLQATYQDQPLLKISPKNKKYFEHNFEQFSV